MQPAYICIITATFCHVCNDMACICCWYTGFSMFKGSEFFVNTDYNTCLLHNGTISEWDTIGRKEQTCLDLWNDSKRHLVFPYKLWFILEKCIVKVSVLRLIYFIFIFLFLYILIAVRNIIVTAWKKMLLSLLIEIHADI